MRYHEFYFENSEPLQPGQIKILNLEHFGVDLGRDAAEYHRLMNEFSKIREEILNLIDKLKYTNALNYQERDRDELRKQISTRDELRKEISRLQNIAAEHQINLTLISRSDAVSERIYQSLHKNCSEFLSQAKNAGCMLRGVIKLYDMPCFEGIPWDNRKPKDTLQSVHDSINRAMIANGYIAHRGNSVMCTTQESVAKEYGAVYIIVPQNGFKFTWSQFYDDLYSTRFDGMGDWHRILQSFKIVRKIPDSASQDEIETRFLNDELGFKTTDLPMALRSGHEIYIRGKYYAFSLKHFPQLCDLIRS